MSPPDINFIPSEADITDLDYEFFRYSLSSHIHYGID